MDSKRKFSAEEEACREDGKRKKVVTPGAGDEMAVARSECDGLIDVPVVSSEMKDVTTGSSLKPGVAGTSSGEGLGNDLSLDKNEWVEVHVNREDEPNKIKDKGKAIIVNDEASLHKEDRVSTTLEKNGETKSCMHSWIWKQGTGHVCWICNMVDKKNPLMPPGYGSIKYTDVRMRMPIDGLSGTGVFLNPWHKMLMKPHHLDILNFLCRNLAVEKPNGCILAQAPITEKSLIIITFIHSYLSKNPDAKPLLLLPKWTIDFWKREFAGLKINDLTLFDFYSCKGRSQQFEVMNQWLTTDKSILFCGHKHFSSIISQAEDDFTGILLTSPSVVIYDRGTDPRNEMMNFLKLVDRINTPQRVLLTGTLHQSHMREVFNLLNVVYPHFLRYNKAGQKLKTILNLDDSQPARIPRFNQLEEAILSPATDLSDKMGFLTELRMLTNRFIYCHRGELSVEVPGMVDFTVVLKPSLTQKKAWDAEKNAKGKGFKTYSTLSGITLHPALSVFSDRLKNLPPPNDEEMDLLLKDINLEDGVKTKFFLGLIQLCSHTKEKILVVSQYIIPLIFLQRILVKLKGWTNGKETFLLKGDTGVAARETSIKQFNDSPDAKVFFASIKSCNEKICLTGATRVISLDINSSLCLVGQAIELAYHPGQKKKVYTYRLLAAGTSEEEEDVMAATREMVAGVWLDGKSCPVDGKFQIPITQGKYTDDHFLGASYMRDDIKTIYKR